jgi:hypothetical protein
MLYPWPCFICLSVDCCPRNHQNELLNDEQTLRLAKEMFDDKGLRAGRGRMLARCVIVRLTGVDPGPAFPNDY